MKWGLIKLGLDTAGMPGYMPFTDEERAEIDAYHQRVMAGEITPSYVGTNKGRHSHNAAFYTVISNDVPLPSSPNNSVPNTQHAELSIALFEHLKKFSPLNQDTAIASSE